MINPIIGFYDFVLGTFQAMPQPVQALVLLGAGLGGLVSIISIVFRWFIWVTYTLYYSDFYPVL